MASNMWMVFNNQGTMGTYIFADNPYPFSHQIRNVSERDRSMNQALISFNKGEFHSFELTFDFVGTAQYAQFGTIFSLHKSFDFYPFDETRGTTEKFIVEWVNDFNFGLIDSFWNSGYKGSIILEQV